MPKNKTLNIIEYTKGMEIKPGMCISGMPNDDYHNLFISWWSSSDLKNALRSVEYFWQEFNNKKNKTERECKLCFEVGQAYHDAFESLIVYDDLRLFEENAVAFDGKSISKEFRRVKDLNSEKSVIPVASFENIPVMANKAKKLADKLNVFHEGYVELAFFWKDPETGAKLKSKVDYIRLDAELIVDFKTTKDHLEKSFSRDIANLGYHFSAAQYIEGVFQVMGIDIKTFIPIAQNHTPPFEVEFYPLKQAVIEEGNYLFHKVLADISGGKKEPEFKQIGIPFWAMTKIDGDF